MIVGTIVGLVSFLLGAVTGFWVAAWGTKHIADRSGLVLRDGMFVTPSITAEEISRAYNAAIEEVFAEHAPRVD